MMAEIPCKKKSCPNSEDEFHHIIPKFMGGKDIDGRIYLCKKHHGELHSYILKTIWDFLSVEKKEICRNVVKAYTKWWLRK